MIVTETVADGQRRFFPLSGALISVALRDRRGVHDTALEAGRDYEVEQSGIVLHRPPRRGERVVILTQDRVREVAPGSVRRAAMHEASAVAVTAVRASAERPAPAVAPVVRPPRDRTNDPTDIRELQDLLTLAAWETCESIKDRTAEWQDTFARLTAVMRSASSIDGVYAAFDDIEDFLARSP